MEKTSQPRPIAKARLHSQDQAVGAEPPVPGTADNEMQAHEQRQQHQRMRLSFITHTAAVTVVASNESEGEIGEDIPHRLEIELGEGLKQSSGHTELCSKANCYHTTSSVYGDFCANHKPSRLCKVPECRKCAKTGGYCISHGGGRRCGVDNCIKSAKEGGFCIAHGGGKRCRERGCAKSALTGGLCSAHGGGKRCAASYCSKTALKGGLCIAHGGGRRCEVSACPKSAVGGQRCVSHGGGRRCRINECDKGAVRHGVCIRHGARRSRVAEDAGISDDVYRVPTGELPLTKLLRFSPQSASSRNRNRSWQDVIMTEFLPKQSYSCRGAGVQGGDFEMDAKPATGNQSLTHL
ncbi:hypothetical protein PybrP1_005991 [[Pythium] brassicae (nom. inval.)]|nr:hypothetical protein PybrP1_005991 [[Pythium] brassicae (nom. inval.)]